MTRRYAAAIAAAVLACGVAGCTGDDPGPETSSTTTPVTQSPSPSTTAAPTTSTPAGPAGYPEAARANTVEGGAAFVEYYYATLNALFQEPAEGVLESLATSSCEFCRSNEGIVRDLATNKNHYTGPAVSLAGLRPIAGAPTGQQYFTAVSTDLEETVVDSSGKVTFTGEKSSMPVSIAVTWKDGRWLLLGADKA